MAESLKFKAHMNHAMGKYYHTSKDYVSDMKKMGLEPFREGSVKPFKPGTYNGVSEDAKRMMNSVTYDKKGKPNIGDRYIEKLKSMGVKEVPKDLRNQTQGGWRNG